MRLSMERPLELTEGIINCQQEKLAAGGLMGIANVKAAKNVMNVKKTNKNKWL